MMGRAAVGVVAVMVTASAARAEPPSLAVLGIEVIGPNVTPRASVAAIELTSALREQARDSSAYRLAGRDAELLDETLRMCSPASMLTPACLSAIAVDLGVQQLVAGTVQLRGDRIDVHLELFDAAMPGGGKPVRIFRDSVDADALTGDGAVQLARRLYSEVAAADETQPSAQQVVPPQVAVIATTPAAPPVSTVRPVRAWRTAFVVAAAGTVAAGAAIAYGAAESSALGGGLFSFGSKCLEAGGRTVPGDPAGCANAPVDAAVMNAGLVAAAVLGTFGVVAFYEGYVRRDRVVIAPVIGSSEVGAVVRLGW
jgi:hypothetical protein